MAQGSSSRCLSAHFTPSTCHPLCHMFERAFVVSSCLSLSCLSLTSTFPLSQSACSLSGTQSSMSSPPRVKTIALTHKEEYCPVAIYNPLTSPRHQLRRVLLAASPIFTHVVDVFFEWFDFDHVHLQHFEFPNIAQFEKHTRCTSSDHSFGPAFVQSAALMLVFQVVLEYSWLESGTRGVCSRLRSPQ